MSDQKVYVPEPAAPCKHCVEHARHQSEDIGIVWCKHTRTGGIYQVVPALWNCVGPFEDEAHFKRYMVACFGSRTQPLKIN